MKKIVILGSTGSVGRNALDVVARHRDMFEVVGLTAYRSAKLLAVQANRFNVPHLALGDISQYGSLKKALGRKANVFKGPEGIAEVASLSQADVVLVAISGNSAIIPLMQAIRKRKRIALANKESIVSAGSIIMDMARSRGVEIIPVDSEHNSIFQCIKEENKTAVKKIFLMGTGGPLKDVPKGMFDRLKPSRVLAHPVWKMGKKISVDSATMMNKGFEVIEASCLFGVAPSVIEILLQPEAIVHSMVEFADGNIMANLFSPDMRLPIFYALSYPERRPSRLPRPDFSKIRKISFQKPSLTKFPAIGLCYEVCKKGGTYPACLTSANEEAVKLYLKGRINFTGIVNIVIKVLSRHKNIAKPSLGEILAVDTWAREEVSRLTG